MQRLFALLPFVRPYFYPLEQRVLGQLIKVLPEPLQSLAQQQVDEFNLLQRGDYWRMVMFGKFRLRKSRMPPHLLLPVDKGDVKLSRLEFKQGGERNHAVLHAQNGALFTINFGTSYKHQRNIRDLQIIKCRALVKADTAVTPTLREPGS